MLKFKFEFVFVNHLFNNKCHTVNEQCNVKKIKAVYKLKLAMKTTFRACKGASR